MLPWIFTSLFFIITLGTIYEEEETLDIDQDVELFLIDLPPDVILEPSTNYLGNEENEFRTEWT